MDSNKIVFPTSISHHLHVSRRSSSSSSVPERPTYTICRHERNTAGGTWRVKWNRGKDDGLENEVSEMRKWRKKGTTSVMVRQEMSVELNCLRTRMSSQPEDDFSCFIMPFQGIYSLFPQFMLFDVSSHSLSLVVVVPLHFILCIELYLMLFDRLTLSVVFSSYYRFFFSTTHFIPTSRRRWVVAWEISQLWKLFISD